MDSGVFDAGEAEHAPLADGVDVPEGLLDGLKRGLLAGIHLFGFFYEIMNVLISCATTTRHANIYVGGTQMLDKPKRSLKRD